MINKNIRNYECRRLYSESDSYIKEYIAENEDCMKCCLKVEAERGWKEDTGDFIIICENCIDVAKMILRDRKMVEDCKKEYCEFTKKLIQVLAEYELDYTIEKDECRLGVEIVKISYVDKTYQTEVFEKDGVVLFEKESYKITDKTVNDLIDFIGCKNDRLFSGVPREYGSDPKKIYTDLYEKFNWNLVKREQEDFVAPGVGPVWFLDDSNWTAPNGGSWKITISEDKNYIEEIWKKKTKELFHDGYDKVVFAKKQNGQYVFLGVYEVDTIKQDKDSRGKRIWRKIYKKQSDSYMRVWL